LFDKVQEAIDLSNPIILIGHYQDTIRFRVWFSSGFTGTVQTSTGDACGTLNTHGIPGDIFRKHCSYQICSLAS
jgi:hypothetical protein